MHRFHPSRWPLAVWVAVTLVADALRVRYTLGAFSFAPMLALLSGTWLGPVRGASAQAVAAALAMVASPWVPLFAPPREWGFLIGRVAAAWMAGTIATPDDRGAAPGRRVNTTVAIAAALTFWIVWASRYELGPGLIGMYFAAVFVLTATIAFVYARRVVREPGRVVGYVYCLLPYYAVAVAWSWVAAVLAPAGAAGTALLTAPEGAAPATTRAVLFHGFLAHVPGDLIGAVVAAYLVCAVDRGDVAPMTPR